MRIRGPSLGSWLIGQPVVILSVIYAISLFDRLLAVRTWAYLLVALTTVLVVSIIPRYKAAMFAAVIEAMIIWFFAVIQAPISIAHFMAVAIQIPAVQALLVIAAAIIAFLIATLVLTCRSMPQGLRTPMWQFTLGVEKLPKRAEAPA